MVGGQGQSCSSFCPHVTYAFERYQKAVEVMRVSLSTKGYPRKDLIGCLPVCCFEGLAGNILTALVYATSLDARELSPL